MSGESWEYWYPGKEGTVEPELLKLDEILRNKNLHRVLDFGCGTGRHVLHLARKGFEVYGFDASTPAIERAKRLLHQERLRAHLRVHDMLHPLPYSDEFFDAVLAIRVIHHTLVENVRRIATEINRVLNLGGYVFVQVPEYGDHQWVLREASSTHQVLEPGTHVPSEGPEKGVPHHCFTKEELLSLFRNYEPEEMHSQGDHYRGWCLIARKISTSLD